LKFCLLPEKSFISETADFSAMFKTASTGIYTSTATVSPDPLSPISSTSSAMKTLENTEEDPDEPEPSDKGDIQMGYSCYYLCCPSMGAVTHKYL
jgi:hypothetical protein